MNDTNLLNSIGSIVATTEDGKDADAVLSDLERRIHELEVAIGDLRSMQAQCDAPAGRKTLPATRFSLLAKDSADQTETGSVDEALRSLSIEQRIAVKSGLLRAGLMR